MDFPKRYEASATERRLQQEWADSGLYRFDPDSVRIGKSVATALDQIRRNFESDPLTYSRWYLIGKPISFLSWNIVNGQGDIFTAEPLRSPFLDDRKFAALRDLMYLLHWPLMVLGLLGGALAWLRPGWLGLTGNALLGARFVAAVLAYAIVLHIIQRSRCLLYRFLPCPVRAPWRAYNYGP